MSGKKTVLILLAFVVAAAVAWQFRPRPPRKPMPPLPTRLDPKVLAVVGKDYQSGIEPIFKRSCFDCHSRDTVFPWYHAVPGVRQYLDEHVEEGRHDLDLSDGFPFNRETPVLKHLRRIARVVQDGKMPLWDYALMHPKARLSQADKEAVVTWAQGSFDRLTATAKD